MKHENLLFSSVIFFLIGCTVFLLLLGIDQRTNRKISKSTYDPNKPCIALTFDDGPNPQYTPQILDLLYTEQTRATFFVVGEKVEQNKQIILEMYNSGHEIGNHTFSHQDLTKLSQKQLLQEIKQTEEEINKILPTYTLHYVRPPYGHYTEAIKKNMDQTMILWTIDSHDWEMIDAETIAHNVIDNVKDQDIIVFHDNNEETIQALKIIIPKLKERGFQFVTLSQLFAKQ